MTTLTPGILLGIGNALLDVTAEVELSFLLKYGIELDTAVSGDERHASLLVDLEKQYPTTHCAGGSGLNVLRSAQWILRVPGICTFVGCIGNDSAGKMLLKSAEKDGVDAVFQIAECETSLCIVMAVADQRSLCSFQRASSLFSFTEMLRAEMQHRLQRASVIYLSGFFLNVCTRTARYVTTYARENQKRFVLDLGAPRVVDAQAELVRWLLPETDVLFGNEAEFRALGRTLGISDSTNGKNLCKAVQKWISQEAEQLNRDHARILLMTRGKEPVVVATSAEGVTEYPCMEVAKEAIVDVNGAGDAFLGGFLARYIQHCSVDECVTCGLLTSNAVIQQRGCNFPELSPAGR
ncbi:hypothetical protein RvY_09443 [Ramazzottius varieornatus]|uniref:Adenosine kinase n=1 Tax=Ramazzottius varieornatus TaxID=947166 RepID=A0A1D1V9F8_RAMVA|nr:hypothetical protein RvY_09443 [Ramazzottius varieornatus]